MNYAYGVRCSYGKDECRNMCKYTSNNKIAFGTAGVGVVMDPKTKNQQFFIRHKDSIVSIAVHPKGNIIATGSMSSQGQGKMVDIFIWDAESKLILA